MCRVRTRSKCEASSQNLTRKTSHMLNIPYNFLNGFELISKMTPGTSQSAEIRQSAEKSHVWVFEHWKYLIFLYSKAYTTFTSWRSIKVSFSQPSECKIKHLKLCTSCSLELWFASGVWCRTEVKELTFFTPLPYLSLPWCLVQSQMWCCWQGLSAPCCPGESWRWLHAVGRPSTAPLGSWSEASSSSLPPSG